MTFNDSDDDYLLEIINRFDILAVLSRAIDDFLRMEIDDCAWQYLPILFDIGSRLLPYLEELYHRFRGTRINDYL